MQPALSCPQRDDYERLIHGELPPSDVERLSQHLAGCPSCAASVQTLLAEDTLLSAIRGAPVDAPTVDDIPADLTQRLLALPAQSPGEWGCVSAPSLTSLLAPPQAPDEIGRLAHYRVLKVLGEGGMGVVFLAEDTLLGRAVALKTMKPEIAADPRHRQRFLREARAAAKVEHDHLVPIYGVGEDRGVPWLAMPFLKGQSLAELLKRVKVLKPAQAVRLGAQVAKGLAAAHAAGLIHRDVKPANIWVEPEGGGRAKLLDFGLARDQSPPREQGQGHLTRTGAVVGTPAFMAPEQAGGEPLDARADLFSLGCVLYRIVTGWLPFQGQGMMDTLRALATETPPAPHEVNPAVPRPLSALIMSLLAKDRSARPASAAAVAKALEALQEKPASPAPVAIPVTPAAPPNPWADIDVTEPALQPPARGAIPAARAGGPSGHGAARRRPLVAVAAGLLFLLGGGLLLQQIIIRLTDEKGKVRELEVKPGEKIEIVQKPPLDKPGQPQAPKSADADRKAAEWVLSISGTIRIRQNGQERDIQAAKDLPAAAFELVSVNLDNSQKVDDAGLEHLKGLTNLTSLGLYNTRVSDAGLEHLKGLTRLTTLHLNNTRVSDAGLRNLLNLPLKEITLDNSRVSARGFALLRSAFPGAQVIGQPRLSAAEDMLAAGATLVIRAGEGKEDRPIKDITDLPRESFLVRRADCTGVKKPLTELLARLSQPREYEFERLEELNLSGTSIADDALQALEGLPNLRQLDLTGTKVTAAGVAALQEALPKCKIIR